MMPRILAACLLIIAAALSACSPAFNWREVRVAPTHLKAMLPCKPDKGARQVLLAGQRIPMEVVGCDASGATFAVLFADIGDPARLGAVLAEWKKSTLTNLGSKAAQEKPFQPVGALGLPQSLQVAAQGRRPDGSEVRSQAAYFARGSHVFQAVIYSTAIDAEVADTFFSGLGFE